MAADVTSEVPRLESVGLRRSFGGVVAVDLEHLTVAPGHIVGLIGPNGAGKTTVLDLLSGFVAADGGTWAIDGRDVTGASAHRLAAAGVVRTFQLARVLPELSTLDNLRVAAPGHPGARWWQAPFPRSWRAREQAVTEQAHEVLGWLDLAGVARAPAGSLSGGQRRLLEVGRALMVDARVLLLDEPTAGVAPVLVDRLVERLVDLRDRGVSALVIEHDLDLVASLCDELVCLDRGLVVASGRPDAVLGSDRVVEAYLGGTRADR